jgi:hypothetical protein
MPPHTRVPIYNKKTGKITKFKYFPENLITLKQIRVDITQNKMKKCTRCGESKDSSKFTVERCSKDGLRSHCSECAKIEKRVHRYNISDLQYTQLGAKQGEKCKKDLNVIATIKGIRAEIDHDHDTQQVRGLLCHKCITGLGYFLDSIESLKGAIVYLAEHKQRGTCVAETLN